MDVIQQYPEAVPVLAADRFRRLVLVLMIVFSVALPRAGIIMPILKLPLPFGLVFLHIVFWSLLILKPVPRGYLPFLLVFVWYAASVAVAAGIGLFRNAQGNVVLVEIATFLGQVPAFFVAAWLVKDNDDLRLAVRWVAISVLAASVYGIIQFWYGEAIMIPGLTYTAGTQYSIANLRYGEATRILSSYGDPNVFAGSLVLFLPGIAGVLLGQSSVQRGIGRWVLNAGAIVCGVVALAYCNSRAGYFGLAVASIMLFWMFRPRLARLIIPVIVVLWVISEVGLTQRIQNRLTIGETDPRREYGLIALRVSENHPEGAGLGVQAETDGWNRNRVVLTRANSVWSSYNSFYLHLLVRTGVFGLLMFLWMSYRCAHSAFSLVKDSRCASEWKPVILGFLAGFIGVQLAMLFNPFYQLPGGGINLWLALGLAYGIGRVSVSTAESPESSFQLTETAPEMTGDNLKT
jgi:hypothetical protein